ncbi:arginase [Palleronia sp. LCG004]|uniref:arginase n=1 Tax=Palleronia sp. LCG004 TaxID=3079304 RepID=UPI0029426CA0|nr:arginase [Palleronia sp. LCG004]WOI57032.1 arginase [Palleronia sp. LCG004]
MARITLLGVPLDCGKARRGCLMGPDAYRVAGLAETLTDLGHSVSDAGNIAPGEIRQIDGPAHLHALPETVAWTEALAGWGRSSDGLVVFMGGDHALSMGSVAGMAARSADRKRPLFVLWLDAHSDFHSPASSSSGNLHGCPVAYVTGQSGFDAFPPLVAPVLEDRVAMIGLRSVDGAEKRALEQSAISTHDMREIDETGIAAPLRAFLRRVAAAGGDLHVSLDVDLMDPMIAPAVGTTVPGGLTFREAHLVMEVLSEADVVTSLDLVELNPALDERGKTAQLMVDLTASLMGRRIFDRPTQGFIEA